MQCAVCAAQAKNLTPSTTYDGAVVGCPRCGDYQITGTVFDKLLHGDPDCSGQSVQLRVPSIARDCDRVAPSSGSVRGLRCRDPEGVCDFASRNCCPSSEH